MLSSLEQPVPDLGAEPERARASLSAAVSLVLRLLGRDPDPARSREHVLLSLLAERRLRAKEPSDLGALLADVTTPPLERIGALTVDPFMPKRQRTDLAAALNACSRHRPSQRGETGSRSTLPVGSRRGRVARRPSS